MSVSDEKTNGARFLLNAGNIQGMNIEIGKLFTLAWNRKECVVAKATVE